MLYIVSYRNAGEIICCASVVDRTHTARCIQSAEHDNNIRIQQEFTGCDPVKYSNGKIFLFEIRSSIHIYCALSFYPPKKATERQKKIKEKLFTLWMNFQLTLS